MPEYTIKAIWDPEASVWIATSDDLPGLILESGSLDALIERVRFAVPDLLKIDGDNQKPLSMCLISERHETVYAYG